MDQTILLVDDEPAVTESLKRLLRKEPYKILTAQNAEEAQKHLSTTRVDLIVSDERMPGTRGGELLAFVRKQYPDTVRIMLSGHPTLDVALEAINKGEIYRLYTKPCNEIDLALGIRDALQHKALLVQTKRLLRLAHEQQNYLRTLNQREFGTVVRDENGTISLPEPSEELDAVLFEVEQQLDQIDRKCSAKDDEN